MTEPDDRATDRAERALRETLRTHAEGPIFRPLTVEVTSAPRRRWTRWLPAAALIALAVLVVPLVINQTRGGSGSTSAVPAGADTGADTGAERSDATAGAEATGSAPSTPGMRWESHRVLSYQVPTSWGYGWAPASDWCAADSSQSHFGAIVDVAPLPRPVQLILCNRSIPAEELTMFVTVTAIGSADRGWDPPPGWSIAATELDGYRLEVVHPDRESQVAAEIVASVRPIGAVDPNGCAAVGALGGGSEPQIAGVSLCQYDLAGGRQLVASKWLWGRPADEVVEALGTAPKGSGPDDPSCQERGDTFVIVRVRGERPYDVRVQYSGCQGNGITNQGPAQQLTAQACQAIMVAPITFTRGYGRAATMCAPGPTPSAVPAPSASR